MSMTALAAPMAVAISVSPSVYMTEIQVSKTDTSVSKTRAGVQMGRNGVYKTDTSFHKR